MRLSSALARRLRLWTRAAVLLLAGLAPARPAPAHAADSAGTAMGAPASVSAPPAKPAPAPDGSRLFIEKTCVTCHSVGGPSPGVGPELTQVAYRRDRAWLRAWLENAPRIKKGTLMPRISWNTAMEKDAVIDFLLAARQPIPVADASDGARLFQDYKCSACHAVDHRGGKPRFPDLGGIGRRRTRAWLARWMANPQAVRRTTWEAKSRLSGCERDALVKYLASLK